MLRAWVRSERGEDQVAVLQRHTLDYTMTGARLGMTYLLALIAESMSRQGRFAAALEIASRNVYTGNAVV